VARQERKTPSSRAKGKQTEAVATAQSKGNVGKGTRIHYTPSPARAAGCQKVMCMEGGTGGGNGSSAINFPGGGKPPTNKKDTAGWIAAATAFVAGVFGGSKTDNRTNSKGQQEQVQETATDSAAGGATPPGNEPEKDKGCPPGKVCDENGNITGKRIALGNDSQTSNNRSSSQQTTSRKKLSTVMAKPAPQAREIEQSGMQLET
jgi:hypothetical protein